MITALSVVLGLAVVGLVVALVLTRHKGTTCILPTAVVVKQNNTSHNLEVTPTSVIENGQEYQKTNWPQIQPLLEAMTAGRACTLPPKNQLRKSRTYKKSVEFDFDSDGSNASKFIADGTWSEYHGS